jgi:hypothetical protein
MLAAQRHGAATIDAGGDTASEPVWQFHFRGACEPSERDTRHAHAEEHFAGRGELLIVF